MVRWKSFSVAAFTVIVPLPLPSCLVFFVIETPIIKGHYFGFGTLPHPGQPSSPASLDQEEQLRITKEKIALADEKISMANEKFVRLKNDKADQGKVMKQISNW
ncbi:hypothetical protein Bca4012_013044 [Brassica carinata]